MAIPLGKPPSWPIGLMGKTHQGRATNALAITGSVIVALSVVTALARPQALTISLAIILITASLASHAVGDVRDTLFLVLADDIAWCMLVATVARVGAIVGGLVTGGALRVVIAVQKEER